MKRLIFGSKSSPPILGGVAEGRGGKWSLLFFCSIALWLCSSAALSNAAPATVFKTGQTSSYVTGDDGDLEKGVIWPAPRFHDNGNGTVTDNLSGLIWLKNANCTDTSGGVTKGSGYLTWPNALTWSNSLASGACGLSDASNAGDWRLPNREELESLIDFGYYSPALSNSAGTGHWTQGDPFTNVQSYFYWSSSTYAYDTSNAWVVLMWDGDVYYDGKSDGHYVWPVRGGQSGSFGNLDHFVFSSISSPQAVGANIPVTITAKDVNGNTMTGWNGTISLWSSAGSKSVYPGTVPLVNGQWTGDVSLTSGGSSIYLIAGTFSASGYSNSFDVTGQGSQYGNLSGEIRDRKGGLVTGGVQIIVDGPHNYSMTVSGGRYQFPLNTIVCGSYTAWAEYNTIVSPEYTVYVPCNGKSVTQKFVLPYSPSACNPNKKTPVLLLAGVMGSATESEGIFFPVLPATAPKWDSDDIYLFASSIVGWDTLKTKLGSDYEKDCTLFEVPYDWRMDIGKIAGEYLKPWVEKAKDKSGMPTVNIIAHSMGGLVTRAYIQGEAKKRNGDSVAYGNDIDKFAMVGTPNEGSSKMYYMWEGGDPALLDKIVAPWSPWKWDDFYWNTTEQNYDETHWFDPLWSWQHDKIWDYYTGGKPEGDDKNGMLGLKELLPTYAFLRHSKNDSQIDPLDVVTNDFLIGLNGSGAAADLSKVDIAVFVGLDGGHTIRNIDVSGTGGTDRYSDGFIIGDKHSVAKWDVGDETVLSSSAALPYSKGWAKRIRYGTTGDCEKHSKLIKCFADDLVSFLNGTLPVGMSEVEAQPETAAIAIGGKYLSLGLKGRVQPYLLDPAGAGSGVNLTTGLLENNITGGTVKLSPDSGAIVIENPADGIYTLTLTGFYNEDFGLTLSFMDSSSAKDIKLRGFNHSNTTSFTFTLDSASANLIMINATPLPPTGLQADAVNSSGLKTRLTWTANTDAGVTGYNIYAKYEDEPYLAQIGTSATNAFNTGNAWAENATIVASLYAVAAKKADGTESFLSDTVENNDRDHDGLTDEQETALGTNVSNPDSDGDGLKDGEEYTRGTNPLLTDTDGDGYSDYVEVQAGSDPLDANSVPPHTLTVTNAGTGSGTVTSNPSGINCGVDCSEVYTSITVVTLSPTPNTGSQFIGWSGDADCSDGSVTMNADKTCTATFNKKTMFEETDTAIAYTGTWTNYTCAACSSGAVKYSGQNGAKASLTFTGRGIKWLTAKSFQLGKAKVFIDNVLQTTVDLYSSTAKAKMVVYQKTGMTNSSHTIRIDFTGTKNVLSKGTIIDLDAFEVVP